MNQPPTFGEVAREWSKSLDTRDSHRTRRPLSENAKRIYRSNLARLIEHFGTASLPVTNKMLRDYIAAMRSEGYSSSQIKGDIVVLKMASEDDCDDNGNPRYPLVINRKFCVIPKAKPEQPCATRAQIERFVATPGDVGVLTAICAGAGLRVSEALALYVGDVDGTEDAWDAACAAIHVRRTLKTESAARTMYIAPELNAFLVERCSHFALGQQMFSLSDSEMRKIYRMFQKSELPPWHSLRRFYATHRSDTGMNREALKRLLGHSKGNDVTSQYVKTGEDFIRAEAQRVGLGFKLPLVPARLTEPAHHTEMAAVTA